MQKLWQKSWNLNTAVEIFETEGDLSLDQKLVEFDVHASLAHAYGLQKIGVLSIQEIECLKKGFQNILELNKNGNFILQLGDEDVHTKIENYLTETVGEVGKKIHTGRSRNDQVLTAIRLYSKNSLLQIWAETLELAEIFIEFAQKHSEVMLPGYTHMQRAMPSTLGIWAGSFAEGLLDDLTVLKAAYQLNDQSPLGSAASYGVPLPLDRQLVADLLGFAKVQSNSLYCQNSRGKIEAAVVASLISILQEINKFATDVLLFSTTEFGFLEVASELCSGSSIMPQKRNVDIAELLRSKVHLLLGNYTQLVSLSSNLPSGYNRDLQDSKKPLMNSLELTQQCVQIAKLLASSIQPNGEKISRAISSELFATHFALHLVQQGMPFREAYQKAAAEYQNVDKNTFSILDSTHIGGTGNLGLELLSEQLNQESTLYSQANSTYESATHNLLSMKGIDEK